MRLPGGWELIIILVIVIVIFGVGKVADVGPALGKAISGFKRAVKDDDDEKEKAVVKEETVEAESVEKEE
jgi:sec-independent protein translocase protein TatA